MAEGSYVHVDRMGQLIEGQELLLHDPSTRDPLPWENVRDQLMELLTDTYPEGLTYQGLSYFFFQHLMFPVPEQPVSLAELDNMRSRAIELVVELVRRADFPERPSRLQVIFAWETEEDARSFMASRQDMAQAVLWRVEGECVFRADMENLRYFTPLVSWWLARQYWTGATNLDLPPRWELFLKPPVRVVERVEP
jgi:hypothetical protein